MIGEFKNVLKLSDYVLMKLMQIQNIAKHDINSAIDPLNGGVDHYKSGQCPGIPPSGAIVPIQEDRYNDTSPGAQNETTEQLEIFTSHFKLIETYSQEYDTNFYVGHRPILGIGCDGGKVVTLDWTLQQSLGLTTLDRISGLITGHMQ